jgi:hypothetical protein
MHAQVKTHVGAEALRRTELHPELDATRRDIETLVSLAP